MHTELSQAREHLRRCQDELAAVRKKVGFLVPPALKGYLRRVFVQRMRIDMEGHRVQAERAVLAALSWVWDAQEREIVARADDIERRVRSGALSLNEARAEVGMPPIENPLYDLRGAHLL